jgi:uncharacterized protein (TIGR00661 family)
MANPAHKVIVSPLDWGLGHATRSIPVIRELLKQGAEVVIASNGKALALLRTEFPDLRSWELPAYDVLYPSENIYLNVAQQMPKIIAAILQEQRVIAKIERQENAKAIVSDHRYGCRIRNGINVIMAHQLHLPVLFPIKLATQSIHWTQMRKFNECWVPDFPDAPNLSGHLGHPSLPRVITRYVGPLSRFEYQELPKKYDFIAIISGPEPQKTYFAEKLRQQAAELADHSFLFVLGNPEQAFYEKVEGNITFVPHLATLKLQEAVSQSKYVICRSGYSSIMDLVVLGTPALLVPTPGQTEQEYCAEHLQAQGLFTVQSQSELNLRAALPLLQQSKSLRDFRPNAKPSLLSIAVGSLLQLIEGLPSETDFGDS